MSFGFGIAVDSAGSAYVTGLTGSTDFPTANAFQGTNGGDVDAFVTKFNAADQRLSIPLISAAAGTSTVAPTKAVASQLTRPVMRTSRADPIREFSDR